MKAVILAAGQGTRLEPITRDIPKCLATVGGIPLIDRLIARIAEAGIESLVVVAGHLSEVLVRHLESSVLPLAKRAEVVVNERYADWGNFYSLLVAEEALGGSSFIKLDGDVMIDGEVLPRLLAAPGPVAIAVDGSVALGDEEMKARTDDQGRIVELSKSIAPSAAAGESIGIERVDAEAFATVFGALRELIDRGETHEYYERAYELLMARDVRFQVADVSGCAWCEIDDMADLAAAEKLLARS